jgi:phosphatidylglycerophosphate synthase
MFDAFMRRVIDPPLNRAGRGLARVGISADGLTLLGLVAGLACGAAIAARHDGLALLLLLLSRLLDGLDGATARASGHTDRGGFIDIVFDFTFYGAIPLAFAVRDPGANALAATVLLFAFYVNGAGFLAFAALAAKRGLESQVHGVKAIYFTVGLAEGTETILVFAAMILVPGLFPPLAYGFAALTLLGAVARVGMAWRVLGDDRSAGAPP